MIKLKLSFGEGAEGKEIEIVDGELLSAGIERMISEVPLAGREAGDVFQAVVNGHFIEKDLWVFTALKATDTVMVSPRIKDGESGQIFKQIAIIAISAVASYFLTPVGGATIYSALAVAAVTIASSLILNALIPPPTLGGADLSTVGGLEDSQMYSIGSQSNQIKRFDSVPKVYGRHRMYPNVAANPYSELATDPDTGQLVQYIYLLYDFGFGPAIVSDLAIGDTPLNTTNFTDFQYRFVDLNRPAVSTGIWDEYVSNKFMLYKGAAEGTPLAIGLDGNSEVGDAQSTWESIQDSAPNTTGNDQSITLTFVCPSGLYGYNASGTRAYRRIQLDIEFSKVGEDIWRAYNNPDYVDYFEGVGAQTDQFNFQTPFVPQVPAKGASYNTEFYDGYLALPHNDWDVLGASTNSNALRMYLKAGQRRILVYPHADFSIGFPIFINGTDFIGNIAAYDVYGGNPAYRVITLDRDIHGPDWPNTLIGRTQIFNLSGRIHVESGDTDYTWNYNGFDLEAFVQSSTHGLGRLAIQRENTQPVYASVKFQPKQTGQYQIRVRRQNTSGPFNSTVSDRMTWTSLVTRFDRIPITTDKRHVFLELRIKATSQLNGTISNLSGIVSSAIDVYDGSSWTKQLSANPAWVFADLLTSDVNKKPIPKSKLDLVSLKEWADFCAEVPPTPPSGAVNLFSRFTCNFVLDFTTTLQGILNQVSNAAQANLNIIDGKYGVLVDKLRTTPVQIFTPRNSKDFTSSRIYTSRPDAVSVKYIDPNADWNVAEIAVYDNGFDATTATNIEDLTSFACTDNEQAWRFGRYMIAQNRLRQETISLTVDFEQMVCTRGDYVQITQDVMRVGGTPARVKAVDVLPGFFGGTYTRITIDDELDQIALVNYGYTYRNVDGIATSTLSFDSGILSSQKFTPNAWPPTGGAVEFQYNGNTTVSIPYTDMLSSTFIFAIRALAGTGIMEFNLEETLGVFNGTFEVEWDDTFEQTPELTVVSNTLTYGGGAVAWTTDYTVGTPPRPDQFVLDDDAYTPGVGDLIIIGEVGSIVFDCLVKSISPNEDMSATIVLVEKADGVYDYESTDTLPDYVPQISATSNPDQKPPAEVEQLVVVDSGYECNASSTGYDYFISLDWNAPLGSTYEFFAVYVDYGKGYLDIAHPRNSSYVYILDPAYLGVEHKFKVIAVSAAGRKLDLSAVSSVSETVESKTSPPSDVDFLGIDITNEVIQFSWDRVADCDVKEYWIRYSPSLTTGNWEASTTLLRVDKHASLASAQARTGIYFIKAIDYNGNASTNAAEAITTIPNLFNLNVIDVLDDAPTFDGNYEGTDFLVDSVILGTAVAGGVDVAEYYSEGFYVYHDLLDLGDVYTVRLNSSIQAEGIMAADLMANWTELDTVDQMTHVIPHTDWDVETQYRTTDRLNVMEDWVELSDLVQINEGASDNYSPWRPFTMGDATGRIFEFRLRLISNRLTVTPRVFDAAVRADMPDRVDSYNNLLATALDGYTLTYTPAFKGPGTTPNVQISIDNAQSGDYWAFDSKTLTGIVIRFYNKNDIAVARQFDVAVKGYGSKFTNII